MRKLTIRKVRHIVSGNAEYEIALEGVATCCLTWDEMLGGVARAFIREFFIGLTTDSIKYRVSSDEWQIEYELQIEEIHGLYLITDEDRFISHLTFDEMLGFIAQYTLIGSQMFSGLQTYQQWIQGPYRKKEIAGLLPVSTIGAVE